MYLGLILDFLPYPMGQLSIKHRYNQCKYRSFTVGFRIWQGSSSLNSVSVFSWLLLDICFVHVNFNTNLLSSIK